MPINWIKGFRRIGWVVTFPLAAIPVFFFYNHTIVFAGYDAEAIALVVEENPYIHIDVNDCLRQLPNENRDALIALADKEVPVPTITNPDGQEARPDVVARLQNLLVRGVLALLETERLNGWSPKKLTELRKLTDALDRRSVEIRRVSKLKLAGLILGAFGCVALLIQGSISLLAWVLRGFKGIKGTSHFDA
jgi:hypothetical protein